MEKLLFRILKNSFKINFYQKMINKYLRIKFYFMQIKFLIVQSKAINDNSLLNNINFKERRKKKKKNNNKCNKNYNNVKYLNIS